MWDAIIEIDPDADPDALVGDLVIVFFDAKCELNRNTREQVERLAVRMRGDRDLQFAFAPLDTHGPLHRTCAPGELPAIVFYEEGREEEHANAMDDVIELVEELIASRK